MTFYNQEAQFLTQIAELIAEREALRDQVNKLLIAENRAWYKGRDAAIQKVEQWMTSWASDLYYSRDQYIDAMSSGKHAGRTISKEMAQGFAKEFRLQAEAISWAIDPLCIDLKGLNRPIEEKK